MDITCVERKYKICGDGIIYYIAAKRELNEELTKKFLHEDMELKTFLEYYEIKGSQQEDEDIFPTNEISDVIEINVSGKDTKTVQIKSRKNQTFANIPPRRIREQVILKEMPREFALNDIIVFYKNKKENYDIGKLKSRFSSTLQKLKKANIVEIVNPNTNRRYRRYRILV